MAAHWGQPSDSFAVHPANVAPFKLFIAMASQWRNAALTTPTQSMVVRTGLDYGVLDQTRKLAGLAKLTPAEFQRLQLLEAEALAAWREDREQAA